jgi:hypothetical protein
MKQQSKQRVVHTIDLGPEQLQIIEEPDQQIRVLFRGIWLREGFGPRTRGEVEQQLPRVPRFVESM